MFIVFLVAARTTSLVPSQRCGSSTWQSSEIYETACSKYIDSVIMAVSTPPAHSFFPFSFPFPGLFGFGVSFLFLFFSLFFSF